MRNAERCKAEGAEVAALQKQLTALIQQLSEAERQNGGLHMKCIAKEEVWPKGCGVTA